MTLLEKTASAQNIAEPGGRAPQAKLAEQAEGLSGSDLFQLCSRAAALAAGEHLQEWVLLNYFNVQQRIAILLSSVTMLLCDASAYITL